MPDAWDTGEMGGRAQLYRGFRVSSSGGDRAVGGNENKKESRNVCLHYHV